MAALDHDFPDGKPTIVWGTEWSSIDTVIAAIGLLTAQQALGLDTAGTEALLQGIDWDDLIKPDGMISMGYTYEGKRIPGPGIPSAGKAGWSNWPTPAPPAKWRL